MKKAEVKKEKKKNVLKEYWPLYLMMLPALLYLLINNYIPMAGMVIAFKKLNFAKGIWASPWAGLKNFKFLFASKDAWIITRNTLLYNVAFILVNMVVGIAIAILITEVRNTKLKKIYQSAILLPFLMSMVILSYIVYALLSAENGLVNNSILPLFHMDPIQWYQKPKYWPAILIIANCWKGVGYGCLIYIASLIGIDPSFYEAARLDGASKWQEITKITLPSLVPTIITLLLLSIGRIFYSDFGCCVVRPVRLDRSVKAFVDFIGFSPARWNSLLRKNFTLRFRQTPPVGRSEKARRHSPELQWSPIPITSD